jgi:hypothetical protein
MTVGACSIVVPVDQLMFLFSLHFSAFAAAQASMLHGGLQRDSVTRGAEYMLF